MDAELERWERRVKVHKPGDEISDYAGNPHTALASGLTSDADFPSVVLCKSHPEALGADGHPYVDVGGP